MTQIHNQPCSRCGSSDAVTIYEDGSAYCFSCRSSLFKPPFASAPGQENKKLPDTFLKGRSTAVTDRKLTQKTCAKYRYNTGTFKGRQVQIATYRDLDGNPVFQKIRYSDEKDFFIIGTYRPILYGMHLFKGNDKKIIITEGEIDCLSVYQVIGDFPVVSIPGGAAEAAKAIKINLEWLERFEEVVFMFDSDEYGRAAAKKCASLLSIGKAKIVTLPLKDANEMLKAGREKELYKYSWRGLEYRPDGIVSGEKLWEEINKPVNYGLSYPFQTLTKLTYGIRTSEFIVFGAGTGMGKTEFFKEIEAHLLINHQQKIGVIHLEETAKETVLGLMNKYSGIKFHLPDTQYTLEEKRTAFNETIGTNRVYIYDSYGTTDLDTIKNHIRYMVKGKDCRYIFLDHITALGDAVEDSHKTNQYMRRVVSELAMLTRELDFGLFTISHLRKTENQKPHEEGGRVHLDDLYGAAALKQWANFVFGLERNQQAEDVDERHTTTLRVLKDRYTGQATGCTIKIKYDEETSKLYELGDDIAASFDEKGDY